MATIRVPSQYATLALGVAALTNNDILMIDGEVPTVTSSIITTQTSIRVMTDGPMRTIPLTAAVFGSSNLIGWEFHDIRFVWSSTATPVTSAYARASYFRCVFDNTARVISSTQSTLSIGHSNAENIPIIVRDCVFIMPTGVNSGRGVYGSAASTTFPLHCIIEGNTFYNYRNAASSQVIRIFGSTHADFRWYVTHNSFIGININSTSTGIIGCGVSTFGANSVLLIANNVIDRRTGATAGTDINLTAITSGGTWQVLHNARHTTGNAGTFITASPLVSLNNTTGSDRVLDDNDWPIGRAYRTGVDTPTKKDQRHRAFADPPSAGAIERLSDRRPRFHVKWGRLDLLPGLTVTIAATSINLTQTTQVVAEDPFDLSLKLTQFVVSRLTTAQPSGGFQVWYDGENYRAQTCTYATFTLSTSGTAARIMGNSTVIAQNAATLGVDGNTLITTYIIDEEVEGDELRNQGDMTGIGRPIVMNYPQDSRRWTYTIKSVSLAEDVRQIGRTRAERVFGQYYRGREMRVWRRIDNDLPWGVSNRYGYSDLLPVDIEASIRHVFFDAHRTRFAFEIQGVEVRE